MGGPTALITNNLLRSGYSLTHLLNRLRHCLRAIGHALRGFGHHLDSSGNHSANLSHALRVGICMFGKGVAKSTVYGDVHAFFLLLRLRSPFSSLRLANLIVAITV